MYLIFSKIKGGDPILKEIRFFNQAQFGAMSDCKEIAQFAQGFTILI